MSAINARGCGGFSLIELIAGIVILAMAITAMTTTIFPQATKSVDPVYQLRAAQLGQSLLDEILGKAFDENTDYTQGLRCGEAGASACSDAVNFGVSDAGETSVNDFDDVDDYHGYSHTQARLQSGSDYDELYRNFEFSVSVIYDGDYDGSSDGIEVAKRVDIAVKTPGAAGQTYRFAGYKGNY